MAGTWESYTGHTRSEPAPKSRPALGHQHDAWIRPRSLRSAEGRIPEGRDSGSPLSLAHRSIPRAASAAGHALASLRDEGVSSGSGMSFHISEAIRSRKRGAEHRVFDNWLTHAIESPAPERAELLANWREAPLASYAHPREEHLIPLMVAAGAGGDAPGKRIFNDEPMGATISAFRFDG